MDWLGGSGRRGSNLKYWLLSEWEERIVVLLLFCRGRLVWLALIWRHGLSARVLPNRQLDVTAEVIADFNLQFIYLLASSCWCLSHTAITSSLWELIRKWEASRGSMRKVSTTLNILLSFLLGFSLSLEQCSRQLAEGWPFEVLRGFLDWEDVFHYFDWTSLLFHIITFVNILNSQFL